MARENVGMFHVVLYYIQNYLNEVLYTHNSRTASYGCMALMLLRIHVFVRLPRCYDCNKLGRSIDGVQTACFNQGTGDAFQAWLRDFFFIFSRAYRLAVDSTLPPTHWIPGTIFPH
jgi:hypothetical protein